MVRSSMQFIAIDQPTKSILVTSSTPSEGKSTTVANLGAVMAQAGLKTVIVDADLRRPIQHQLFEVPNLGGLTDLLCSPDLEESSYLKKTKLENLYLIPSGVIPPNPSELLGSQRMAQLTIKLSELADVIIYDSPPALTVTDAVVLSNRVDGVVLVVEAGRTRRDAAQRAIASLQQAGANLLGGLLNRVSSKRGGYYYYYHHYYPSNSRNGFSSDQKPVRTTPRQRKWLPFGR
jgi:capsular exopolysaccharide synthesis family protein